MGNPASVKIRRSWIIILIYKLQGTNSINYFTDLIRNWRGQDWFVQKVLFHYDNAPVLYLYFREVFVRWEIISGSTEPILKSLLKIEATLFVSVIYYYVLGYLLTGKMTTVISNLYADVNLILNKYRITKHLKYLTSRGRRKLVQ